MYSNYGIFYIVNAPRNVANPFAQSFSTGYGHLWRGHVCPPNLGITCTRATASLLPTGQYKIRYAALKHFGNHSVSDDYDVYYTPSFTLVY